MYRIYEMMISFMSTYRGQAKQREKRDTDKNEA